MTIYILINIIMGRAYDKIQGSINVINVVVVYCIIMFL